MPFFPLFVNLEKKNILVVGGGKVASRKIEILLLFKPREITVVAKETSKTVSDLTKNGTIVLYKRAFKESDIDGKDMVIVAADDIDLQISIFKLCKKKNLPVNCVDSPDYCSFIFPSVIIRGNFVIGISTSGKAPSISKRIRKFIETQLPSDIENIVDDVAKIRKSNLKDGVKEMLQ